MLKTLQKLHDRFYAWLYETEIHLPRLAWFRRNRPES
jgi:hypothetical protein